MNAKRFGVVFTFIDAVLFLALGGIQFLAVGVLSGWQMWVSIAAGITFTAFGGWRFRRAIRRFREPTLQR